MWCALIFNYIKSCATLCDWTDEQLCVTEQIFSDTKMTCAICASGNCFFELKGKLSFYSMHDSIKIRCLQIFLAATSLYNTLLVYLIKGYQCLKYIHQWHSRMVAHTTQGASKHPHICTDGHLNNIMDINPCDYYTCCNSYSGCRTAHPNWCHNEL